MKRQISVYLRTFVLQRLQSGGLSPVCFIQEESPGNTEHPTS